MEDSPVAGRALWNAGPHWSAARAALSAGRYAEALQALSRARRWRGAPKPLLALAEADALLAWQRYREAIGVTTRALARRLEDRDLVARLRGARGSALWLMGRLDAGVGELRRALREASAPETVARIHESLGVVAWRDQSEEQAWTHLERARELHESSRSPAGLVRVLEAQTGLLRDAGRLHDALDLVARRLESSAAIGRRDCEALARCDRGMLLAELGRFEDARDELERAAKLLRELGDPRELTRVGVARAALALMAGDLELARVALERARDVHLGEGSDPRLRGEALIATSDLLLASTDATGAERAAAEALSCFALVRDRSGQCRSRARRSHALLALGQPLEAGREARRALEAGGSRPELEAAAQLALGRAHLRTRPEEAAAAFERAVGLCTRKPALAHAARLGRALAGGASPEADDVRRSLAALEAWGDRLLLFHCLASVRDLHPSRAGGPVPQDVPAGRDTDCALSAPLPGLVDAVAALMGEGDWPRRWARAMAAVGPHLGARRIVLVREREALQCGTPEPRAASEAGFTPAERAGEVEGVRRSTPSLNDDGSWQWLATSEDASPLPADDLARELPLGRAPMLCRHSEEGPLRDHPSRALHGIGASAVVPVSPGVVLCVDYAEGRASGAADLSAVIELARLVSLHLPAVAPREPASRGSAAAAFPGIVGRCAAMRALYEAMEQAAASDVPVHVFGETGTGKEKVARGIHERSRRRGAFVAVNASTLPDELFESEMYGHVRGAFTGAVAARQGHVEAAAGGTLFLDEVTDLSPRAQAKLLRFLQDGEYRRLGETITRRSDVRILTASNLRLEQRVAAGLLREDLMYRLNVLVLSLPPLRERGDDVLLLARHFLREASRGAEPRLPPEVARILMRHRWSGNIRELQSEMQRVAIRAGGGPLRKEHLSPELTASPALRRSTLKEMLLDHERRHVSETLARHGGRRATAACELGVTRQALAAKIRRLGIVTVC